MPRGLSPCAAHFAKMTAASQQTDTPTQREVDAYELTLAALIEDRRRLHDIQSLERKIAAKREMIPQYLPYIDGVLSTGTGKRDDIVTTLMVWLLDIADLKNAARLAEYVLKHNMTLPENYSRSAAAALAEEAADTVLRAGLKLEWKQGAIVNALEEPHPHQNDLEIIFELTATYDMHDQIRAKMLKAIGYCQALHGQHREALEYLQKALHYNSQAGVKKDIERLETLTRRETESHP